MTRRSIIPFLVVLTLLLCSSLSAQTIIPGRPYLTCTAGGPPLVDSVRSSGIYYRIQHGQQFANCRATATQFREHFGEASGIPVSVISVVSSPSSVSMLSGSTQQFTAVVTMSDGSPAVASWNATGGTITTGGLYTAGPDAGTYRVIASAGARVDTSTVQIAANVPPDTTTPPPDPAGVVFSSTWSTALGNSTQAVKDGGKWNNSLCEHSDVLSVVAGSTVGWTLTPNVLQVNNRGETRCYKIETTNSIPQGRSYYARMYIKVDPASSPAGGVSTTFHSVAIDAGSEGGRTQGAPWSIECNSGCSTGYLPATRMALLSFGTYNANYAWTPKNVLQTGTWYRHEWFVELLPNQRFRIWPRIYDMAGNLIRSSDDYENLEKEPGTLTQFYSAGNSSPYDTLRQMAEWAVGYEGTGGAPAGGRWYYAALEIRTDTWPGPVR